MALAMALTDGHGDDVVANTPARVDRDFDSARGGRDRDDITQLDTSDYHVCAVGVGGLVSCWGKDDVAQSTPPAGFSFTQVAVGSYHTCALTTEGSVECWGENYQGQSSPPLD